MKTKRLNHLYTCSSRLHDNNPAFMQAFRCLCSILEILYCSFYSIFSYGECNLCFSPNVAHPWWYHDPPSVWV